MTTFVIIVLALGVVGGIALASWYFSADQKARRAMLAVPRVPIADVTEGQHARVVGQVVLQETIHAPLSGRACAAWRVVVREQRGSGKSRHWVTIIDEHEGVDFQLLGDGGHKALVKSVDIQPVLEKDGKFSSGFLNDAGPGLEAFLADRGHSSQGWVFNKAMQYHEGVVEAGEVVCVVGIGRWERDPDEEATAGEGYREARVPQRLVLDAPPDGPLMICDEPDMVR